MIKEIYLLRSLACIAVVTIHAISISFLDFGFREDPEHFLLNSALFVLQMLLMFGTPLFVFISEFVLANRYQGVAPKNFWIKRIKFILVPYLIIGLFQVVTDLYVNNIISFYIIIKEIIFTVLLGGYHGYFVLIIFQFYFIHFFFNKYIFGKFNAKSVIFVSLIINLTYLFFFNFLIPQEWTWYAKIILFFPAWLAYFTVAYYSGKNIDKFKNYLTKIKYLIPIFTLITGGFIIFLCYTGILTPIQSKRIDIVLYTISIALFLFYFGMKLKKIPNILVKISQYSFGIYLLHPFALNLLSHITFKELNIFNLSINIIIYLVMGILLPILIIMLLNKTTFGPFIVGKIGVKLEER